MKRKLLTCFTVIAVAVTMLLGSTSLTFADKNTTGSLLWSQKVETVGWYGVNSPVLYGNYIYLISNDIVYKIDKSSGEIKNSIDIGDDGIKYSKQAATAAAGKLFVPISNGKLAVIDISKDSMELITIVDIDGEKTGDAYSPAIYSEQDNAVYVGTYSSSDGVYAKVSLNGYEVTEIVDSDRGFYWSGACVDEKYVVFGSDSDGNDPDKETGNAILYAYDKTSKELKQVSLEDSGSIRSTVVKNGDSYYFTSKNKKLYKAYINGEGELKAEVFTELSGVTTCTPVIENGKIYVGSMEEDYKGAVDEINLDDGNIIKTYSGVPADVKNLLISNGNIYCTYNKSPGGIWDVKNNADYFTPESSMQNFCISSIAEDEDGIFYYTNDSNYLMAVKPSENINTYKVSVTAGKGGKATASKSDVEEGGSVVITMAPDEGYKVSKLMLNGEKQDIDDKYATSFEVKNVDGDVKVEVEFEKINAVTSDIEVTVQKQTKFYIAHEKLSVSSDLAERYGYKDNVGYNKVSALDALVAANIKGIDTENKEEINEKLVMSSTGNPTRILGLGSDSEWTGFAVNEDYYAVDNVGTNVNSTPLENGDRVDYFWYEDSWWCDELTVFTQNGEKVFEKDVKTNEKFTLTLEGFIYMMGYEEHEYEPVSEAAICSVDEEGNADYLTSGDEYFITDDNGRVEVSFDKPGTYHLTAVDNSGYSRLIMPWIEVNVTCAEHDYVNGKCTECGDAIQYKVEIGDVKAVGDLDAEQVKEKMIQSIKGINNNISEDDINVMDITLKYSSDGGKTWESAKQGEDFPENGVDIVIPYANGTNGDDYDFVVTHMFGKEYKDYKAEDIERLMPTEVKGGLKVHINSCSPYAVGWEATGTLAADHSSKTGDDFNSVIFAVIAAVALIGIATVVYTRKKSKN